MGCRRFGKAAYAGMLVLWLFPAGYCVSEALGMAAAAAGFHDEEACHQPEELTDVPPREPLEADFEGHWQPSRDFVATAYCLKGRTASGIQARPGIVAADPRVLPLGTVIHVSAGRYSGIYKVMDTGRLIRGRRIDIYVPSYKEAVSFGRRRVKLRAAS